MAETMTAGVQYDPLTDPLVRIVEIHTPIYWEAWVAVKFNGLRESAEQVFVDHKARLDAATARAIQTMGGCGHFSSLPDRDELGPCIAEVGHRDFHHGRDGRRWAY